jgi:hypothetical protein
MSDRPSDEEILSMLQEKDEADALDEITVQGASGTEFQVLISEEAVWFDESLKRYNEQYNFDNIADLQDLDRLLSMELLSYRYANWMIRETDYEGSQYDDKAVRDTKDRIDKQILQLKAHLGIGRKNRVESEQQSVSEYMAELLKRAGQFGVHRDTQNAEILNWFMELRTKIGLHDRSDDEERTHNKVHIDQIIEWVRDELLPAVDEIDGHFRDNQKYWIKDL